MNFLEVLEYLRQSPTNCVTHEEWLTKENKATGFIGCFDKINIYQINYIGDISKERFSNLNLMLSNRWLKLQDWHKSKKERTELHTFEEAVVALKAGKKISRDYKYADVHKFGWDNKFIFFEEDLFANDWIILDK